MVINVAINGFGRIGRMFFRAAQNDKKIKIIAINDLTDTKTLAHLLKFDSTHGVMNEKISATKNYLKIGKNRIPVFSERNPEQLPWKELKIDVVLESTGFFVDPMKSKMHLNAGAKKVVLSAPAKPKNDCNIKHVTLVKGVNEKSYNKKNTHIISNASCTTNCVSPILEVINTHFKIKSCFFSTIHAFTSTQHLVDSPSKDLRRARAASINIIPTSTGAAIATEKVIPKLKGKLSGMAYRVPVVDGSVTDFCIETEKTITVEKVNEIVKKHASNKFKGILQYTEAELVSSDIIGNPHSSIFDAKLTKTLGKNKLKIVCWYDNEWGYSNRLVDMVKFIL